jgi:hypothetical protein
VVWEGWGDEVFGLQQGAEGYTPEEDERKGAHLDAIRGRPVVKNGKATYELHVCRYRKRYNGEQIRCATQSFFGARLKVSKTRDPEASR